MEIREQLYEGKAKIVLATDDPDLVVVRYKDSATALNGLKKGTIASKGIYNNRISTILFNLLAEQGIPTHHVETLNDREMLVKKLSIVPVEVVSRNTVAGSLSKRLGIEEGYVLPMPILEYYYKDDALGDPMVNLYHIQAMGWATDEQMARIADLSLRINQILKAFLAERGLDLIDFKLEFGLHKGEIYLGDEISPDTCRFWDMTTKEKLDKDRFRRDLGKVEEAYVEVLKRIGGSVEND